MLSHLSQFVVFQMSHGFQASALVWWLTIPAAIAFSCLMAHFPSVIPFGSLSIVGSFLFHLVTYYRPLVIVAFWATIVAHVYEASIAHRICRDLRMAQVSTYLWMTQTFILGYPSLRILKSYVRQR